MNKTRLFCFPYAGGSSMIYKKWEHHLDGNIELRPIELAGRGSRIQDPLYKDFNDMVEDVFHQIKAEISCGSYALFGHSLGSLICYELVEKIKEHRLSRPDHIFFSGRGVPHIPDASEISLHLLDHEEFKDELINLGGTPPEFFDHPELAELFLPLLRNDFKMAESFEFHGEVCRYDGNVTVFLGKDDEATAEQYHGWKDYTSKLCNIIYFNGGHLFLHDEMENIAHFINQTLSVRNYFPSKKMKLSKSS